MIVQRRRSIQSSASVPIVGDLFDFAWKANDMNLALLERHAYEERPASPATGCLSLALIVVADLHCGGSVPRCRLADSGRGHLR